MTEAELRARVWCGTACALAQVAATAAGMVPWWALPFSLALTVAVSQPHGPVDQTRARLTRGAGVASVAAFATLIAIRTIRQGRDGIVDPTATLRSLSEALVVLSLIMAPSARSPREHRVWLTVTTGVLVAAAAGGRTLTDGAFALLAWMVLLVATTRVQTVDAYTRGAIPAAVIGRSPKERVWGGATIPIIATLIAGALVYVALPSGLGGGDLVRRIARSVQTANFELADRSDVGVDTNGFGDLSLLVRGQLPDTPILRVPSSSPKLWRGTFYRQYTGTSWTNEDASTFTDIRGDASHLPQIEDDAPTQGGTVRTDTVQVEPGAHADLVWAPGVPIGLHGLSAGVGRVLRGASNVRAVSTIGRPLTSYTVTSVVAPTSPQVLEAATGEDPDNPVWVQLPAELPAEVPALAHRITAGATSRYETVHDIETYLRSHERYSLNVPVPNRGQDAVDDFLFHTHIGFCELFASADAVLIRSLGIPARVVTGLAYGTSQGAERLYTAANAHAWVEVYYPGIGWSPSDPTAGVTLLDDSTGQPSLLSRAFDNVAAAVPGGRLAVSVVGALLLVAVAWLIRRVRRGGVGWVRRRAEVRPAGPVLSAFLRMTKSRDGPPPRAPAETPRQYLARVGGVRPDVGAAAVALEQELYGAWPPTEDDVRRAIATFESLVSSSP